MGDINGTEAPDDILGDQVSSFDSQGTITQKVRAQLARKKIIKSQKKERGKAERIKSAWSNMPADIHTVVGDLESSSMSERKGYEQSHQHHTQVANATYSLVKVGKGLSHLKTPKKNQNSHERNDSSDDKSQTGNLILEKTDVQLQLNLQIFFKMKKMGVPIEAIIHKMTKDGIPQEQILLFRKNANLSEKSPKSKAGLHVVQEDNGTMEKYLKMKKIGIPIGAIRQKMVQDGVSNLTISNFFGKTTAVEAVNKVKGATKRDDQELLKIREENMKNEKKYEKYFKMEKIGIPL